MNILEEICAYTAERVKAKSKLIPLSELKRQALTLKSGNYAFEKALKGEGLSLICEVKKASPSKGVIDPVFDYMQIAADYEKGGADCISCLTEPKWFLGSDEIFSRIRAAVAVPMLRKDFTLTEYQVYESKLLGADAVLIILSALTPLQAKKIFAAAEETGLSALFECRDEAQTELAQRLGGRVVGVNNRNLKDFTVDMEKAKSLRTLVDREKIFVSESGVLSLNDLRRQKEIGADACLVGEFCMRAENRARLIGEMKNV